MPIRFVPFVCFVCFVLAIPSSVAAVTAQPAPPELTAPVNDFAHVIEAEHTRALDGLIRQLEAASGDVIVVVTVKTFEPWGDVRMLANRMFENRGRGIGQKGKDNGLLVLLAVDDREVWIEVGYDLEAIITDGFAGETSRDTMVPFFRGNDYGGGLLAGVSRVAERIAAARNVTLDGLPVQAPPPGGGSDSPAIVWLIVAIVLLNILAARRHGRRRRRWTSAVGPFGAGYGGWTVGKRTGRTGWSSGGGGFGGGFGGFGGGRSGGGGGGARW